MTGSYFAPPASVPTTREAYVPAKTNAALYDVDRRLSAIARRWPELGSARCLELVAGVLLQGECQLVDAANLEARAAAAVLSA